MEHLHSDHPESIPASPAAGDGATAAPGGPRERPKADRWFWAALVGVVFALGAYHICLTTCRTTVAKDAVEYIHQARGLLSDPVETVRTSVKPPGFPAIILLGRTVLFPVRGLMREDLLWAVSAQSVSFAAYLGTILLAGAIARVLAGRRASLLGVAVVSLLPTYTAYGFDGLSDYPSVVFVSGGLYLAMVAVARRRPWWMIAAGLLAGAAYLIRPEGLLLVAVPAEACAARQAIAARGERAERIRWTAAAGLLLLVAAVFVVPYMVLMGSPLPKKATPPPSQEGPAASGPHGQAAPAAHGRPAGSQRVFCAGVADWGGAWEVLDHFATLLRVYFAPLFVIGAVVWFRRRIRGPTDAVFVLVVVLLLVGVGLVALHNAVYGYTSRRHWVPLTVPLAGFLGLGSLVVGGWICSALRRGRRVLAGNPFRWAVAIVALGLLINVPSMLKPLHESRRGLRRAAEWLRARVGEGEGVAVWDPRLPFYADLTNPVPLDERVWPRTLYNWIRAGQVQWMVASVHPGRPDEPPARLIRDTAPDAFRPVRSFSDDSKRTVVYRVDPRGLGVQPGIGLFPDRPGGPASLPARAGGP